MQDNLTRREAIDRWSLLHDIGYEVALDLTGNERDFGSETWIRFGCRDPGAGTFLDLVATSVERVELNGVALPPEAVGRNRIRLEGLATQNEVHVVATCAYNRTEVGMHRFQDPADGLVYLHTHLEPFGAHRTFPCFDQPDLKGTFVFSVLAPQDWLVVSGAPLDGDPQPAEGAMRWTFARTHPLSTYVTAVCAGPYHVVRQRHRDIDLGLLCRRSLAEHLEADELFEVTRQGFDFFERAFGYPYPFGPKYDQIFIPESNSGAMENAGLITFNDAYLFRSRVTDWSRERRAETVLHEMAHMWFGDLVTLKWWNDLWLNESFASYMAVLSQASATRWAEAWTTFADTEKTWAYRQDQLPTTHPIVADVPDVESVHLNFDGISYAKGASVLRQLVAWVGQDRFFESLEAYCRRHEFGNAELSDFLAGLEEASGRDLRAWSKEWLEAEGVNTIRAAFSEEDGRLASFALEQSAPPDHPTLRRHRLAVGLYDLDGERLNLRRRLELDAAGARTEVPELSGEAPADLVLVNDGDLTFAKIRLDDRSLATAVEHLSGLKDSLARTLCWTACWDMTRDAEMRARDYLRLVIRNVENEPRIGVVQSLLAQTSSAVNVYGDPANRAAAMGELAALSLSGLQRAQPGSDRQLAWARSFIASARSEEHLARLRGLLDSSQLFDGLAVDTELRWHMVRALASAGVGGDELIENEHRRDLTDRGARYAASCRAARPVPSAKEEAWRAIVENTSLPLALIEEIMGGFHQFGQEPLLVPYADRYFEALPGVWETKDLPDALAFARRMYPHMVIDPLTVERTDAHLGRDSLPAPIRRLLLEGRDGVARALRARAVDARR